MDYTTSHFTWSILGPLPLCSLLHGPLSRVHTWNQPNFPADRFFHLCTTCQTRTLYPQVDCHSSYASVWCLWEKFRLEKSHISKSIIAKRFCWIGNITRHWGKHMLCKRIQRRHLVSPWMKWCCQTFSIHKPRLHQSYMHKGEHLLKYCQIFI